MASILSEALKPSRIKLSIQNGVLDVLVPEIGLDGTGVFALAGKLVALAVAEHVGVDRKGQIGLFARALNNRVDRPGGQGRLAL